MPDVEKLEGWVTEEVLLRIWKAGWHVAGEEHTEG